MSDPRSESKQIPHHVVVTKEREVFTYSELWHASRCVLEAGIADKAGSTWQFMSSIVLTTFAFEAYLNHAGETSIAYWDSLERLSPWAKMQLLADRLTAELGKSSDRPLQTITAMIRFRNTLAHGRSETLKPEPVKSTVADYQRLLADDPLSKWEETIQDGEFAQRCRADVEAVLKLLHAKRPEPKEQLFAFGPGLKGAELILGER